MIPRPNPRRKDWIPERRGSRAPNPMKTKDKYLTVLERIADALEGIRTQLEDMSDGTTTSDQLELLRGVLERANERKEQE